MRVLTKSAHGATATSSVSSLAGLKDEKIAYLTKELEAARSRAGSSDVLEVCCKTKNAKRYERKREDERCPITVRVQSRPVECLSRVRTQGRKTAHAIDKRRA